ncbi:MAG TPA: UDP-N-acetylmuramoyl-tripeptide--D-alanyl-D-alanine ligase [Armatimonadetes bacterium]|nr:UDP-N-acetylmuramoyl-tripeptide--D-alanyl-D-alanine ligase [Armatimonadota bacterium]
MRSITIEQVARWTNGTIMRVASRAKELNGVATDSRAVEPGMIFIALRGERFDGHEFVRDAIERGASAVIVHQLDAVPRDAQVSVVTVNDTLRALGDLAGGYLRWLTADADCRVVAVTGSSGKTTTKFMIGHVLNRSFATLVSPESFNNEIGVPLTILQLESSHRILVLEYAARHRGDISYLCNIARPDVSVITNIGKAHIGIFGSERAILDAKAEIIEALPREGCAILNADDSAFNELRMRTQGRILSFSVAGDDAIDVRAEDIKWLPTGMQFRVRTAHASFNAYLPIFGEHNISNALAALATALALKGELSERDITALSTFTPPKMRLEIKTTSNGVTIINDAYNANPDSMRAALHVLKRYPTSGRRVAVLGEMKELGDASFDEHFKLGWELPDYDVDIAIIVGPAKPIADGISARMREVSKQQEAIALFVADDADDATHLLRKHLTAGDVVLVKASRAVQLERIVERLCGDKGDRDD